MKFIEEVVVESVLPTVRSMLADALRERGLTQREVAEALGISQSAVSKYAHGEVDRNDRVRRDDRVVRLVEEVADGLAGGEMTSVQALIEFEVLIRRLERGDLIAGLHQAAMPGLDASASDAIHDPEGELRAAERVLASVRRGLDRLERTDGVAALIPNVGSNLVEATPNATDIDDVAGVPGRLFDVKGRLEIPADPEFGASGHVATVLLAARDAGNDALAAVNLRYEPDLLEALESAGFEATAFDAEHDDIGLAVGEAMAGSADAIVLYQTGGFGIEPIIYLLAPSATEAADRLRDLIRDD